MCVRVFIFFLLISGEKLECIFSSLTLALTGEHSATADDALGATIVLVLKVKKKINNFDQ